MNKQRLLLQNFCERFFEKCNVSKPKMEILQHAVDLLNAGATAATIGEIVAVTECTALSTK